MECGVRPESMHRVQHRTLEWAWFLGLALLALAIRVPMLETRPMHTDEATQAYLLGEILEGHGYHYQVADHHGPAPLVIAWAVARVNGIRDFAGLNESTLRTAPVLSGVLGVLLFAWLVRGMGLSSAFAGAFLWSVTSLPVYYSRYFIHETLFVGATLGLILSGQRMWQERSLFWAVATGFFVGLMLGCKETAVVAFMASGLAAGPWIKSHHHSRGLLRPVILCVLIGIMIFVSLYSWGGTNWHGPIDFLSSFGREAHRAGGEGHEKPFWYYWHLLFGSPVGFGILLLWVMGVRHGLENRLILLSYFALYGGITLLLYGLIPYKTPWLAMNVWLPICIVAGHGLMALWNKVRYSRSLWIVGGLLLGWLFLLGQETWLRDFAGSYDERNPYAYAHTGSDLLRLPEQINQWAVGQGKKPAELRIAVVMADAWPLPWYLRRYPLVGYWQPNQEPGPADCYITSPEISSTLQARLQSWRFAYYGMRPEVLSVLWTPSN
jgi:uncharacterized protein (TIGR03663 family)